MARVPDEPTSRAPHLARERSSTALLLVDVINDLAVPGCERLVRHVLPMARRAAALKVRAQRAGVACIYVNDNFGRWRSDLRSLVRHAARTTSPGREMVHALMPTPEDYFVLKPQNSGFYSTVLETLLRHLGATTLVITGVTTDNCVLFTAQDAYLRGFRLIVPSDCTAAETPELHRRAMQLIARNLKANVRPSKHLRFRPEGRRRE